MTRPVLITGASGNTGRRITAALLHRGAHLRAFIRRPEAREPLARLGVEDFAIGTLEDASSLAAAVDGAGQVLHICPPMHPQEDAIARTLTGLCEKSGVERLILWSVLHPVIGVPHHRRKLEAEKYLIEFGLTYTILQPSRYMQHLAGTWKSVMDEGVHSMPFSTQASFSLADLEDLAEAAAIVATTPGHDFATYQLAGSEALSQKDCARILSGMLGKPVAASKRPLEDFLAQAKAAGMPPHRLDTMRIMNEHYDAHGLIGNGRILEWLLGRRPRTFAQYVQREMLDRTATRKER
ncbi:MAG: NmrA family NAD(P)-binding protein [Hyphomicrobiales bacterium]|nr:NmrA family NAD(P)-binding protein [Hyphomicrobiales bacterium]